MDAPIDKIIATYVKIRDAKDSIYQKYKQDTAELDEQLTLLKHTLLELSKETGATSFATPTHVAYRKVNNRYWTNDWESFYGFLREHSAMQLLEKRIHQSNMKDFMESNPDAHPPGLNIDSEYDIVVKRK
jgi:hypothetical protein